MLHIPITDEVIWNDSEVVLSTNAKKYTEPVNDEKIFRKTDTITNRKRQTKFIWHLKSIANRADILKAREACGDYQVIYLKRLRVWSENKETCGIEKNKKLRTTKPGICEGT